MKEYFDLAAKRHEEIIKAAFIIPAAAKAMGAAATWAAKNPFKTLGAGLTGYFGLKDAKDAYRGLRAASGVGKAEGAIASKAVF
jgi:hypothetical protein